MIFPRQLSTGPPTISSRVYRPQILEAWTKDQKPRLNRFMLRELGSAHEPSSRVGPTDGYMVGVPDPIDTLSTRTQSTSLLK